MWVVLTALTAEARPLVEAWGLEADAEASPFPIWRGSKGLVAAVGVGKIAMASGVGFLAAQVPEASFWLNVGIAGRRASSPGEEPGAVYWASRVIERATGKSWYPSMVISPPCATATVETVDQPETAYPLDHVYEMEAAAFVAAAQRFGWLDLVQVMKVVSDHHAGHLASLDRARVGQLMEQVLAPLAMVEGEVAPLLAAVAAQSAEPPRFQELVARGFFTFSDRVELRKLLRRKAVLVGDQTWPTAVEEALALRGRAFNRALAAWLDTVGEEKRGEAP